MSGTLPVTVLPSSLSSADFLSESLPVEVFSHTRAAIILFAR
jgi:hypothetical protein